MTELQAVLVQVVAWGIAAPWCIRVTGAIEHLPELADLTDVSWNQSPRSLPSLAVVVPAKDEADNITATLETLIAQDYPAKGGKMIVVAVNDRSTDATGALAAQVAARRPDLLHVLHISELPEGWLGKTFALEAGTQATASEWLLYTDADILFSPSILRRALAFAEQEQAAHVVVPPSPMVKTWGEGVVLGFFQILGLWAARPWKIADPRSQRDVIGIGAFNLIRRDAFDEIGGWPPQRLAVLEDITLGRRIKAAGLPQRIAFAPGLVLVHWAAGGLGLVRVMTKNLFSGVNFRPLLLLGGVFWIIAFCLLPLAGLFWWRTTLPSLAVLLCIAAAYREMGRRTGIDARYGWLYPLGAVAFCWAMLRSMAVAWFRGGVLWRGTHYPLRDLRRHNSPFQWQRAAAREARANRRLAPSRLRRFADRLRPPAPRRQPPQAPRTEREP